jgi:hypothetical protein
MFQGRVTLRPQGAHQPRGHGPVTFATRVSHWHSSRSASVRLTGITRTDRPCDWPSHCRDCPGLCASGPKSRDSGGKVYLSRDEPFAPDEASLNALKFAVASNSGGRDRTTECNVLDIRRPILIAKPIAFGLYSKTNSLWTYEQPNFESQAVCPKYNLPVSPSRRRRARRLTRGFRLL